MINAWSRGVVLASPPLSGLFALPRAAPDRDRRWIVQITQRQRFYPLVRSAPGSLVGTRTTSIRELMTSASDLRLPACKRFFLCCEGPGCFTWAWSLRETGMRICRWCRPGKMMDGSRYAQSGARCMKSSNRPPGFTRHSTRVWQLWKSISGVMQQAAAAADVGQPAAAAAAPAVVREGRHPRSCHLACRRLHVLATLDSGCPS